MFMHNLAPKGIQARERPQIIVPCRLAEGILRPIKDLWEDVGFEYSKLIGSYLSFSLGFAIGNMDAYQYERSFRTSHVIFP